MALLPLAVGLLLAAPAAAQSGDNVVEGGGATGQKVTYNVSGVVLGPRTQAARSYHAYDRGHFTPGGSIEVWGTVQSRTSAAGDVLVRVYVRYWSREHPRGENAADTGGMRFGRGLNDYRVSASIPADAHQVEIRVGTTAAWSFAVTANFGAKLKPHSPEI